MFECNDFFYIIYAEILYNIMYIRLYYDLNTIILNSLI